MRQVRIDLQQGSGGVGYRIDPLTHIYTSGPLKDGELVVDQTTTGEYADPQKFASQLYILVLTALKETPAQPKEPTRE